VVRVSTPGGGGFGDPAKRKPEAIARDVAKGYYSEAEAREKFGKRQIPAALSSRAG
jgi:N-methylhydantoinase B